MLCLRNAGHREAEAIDDLFIEFDSRVGFREFLADSGEDERARKGAEANLTIFFFTFDFECDGC